MHLKELEDRAMKVGVSTYHIFTKNPGTYSLICQNGSNTHGYQLSMYATLRVQSGCYIDLNSFQLYPDNGFKAEEMVRPYKWTLNLTQSVPGMDFGKVSELLHDVKEYHMPPLTISEIASHLSLRYPSFTTYPSILSYIGIIVLAIILFSFVAWYYCKKNRQ